MRKYLPVFSLVVLLFFVIGCQQTEKAATKSDQEQSDIIAVGSVWPGARPYQLAISQDGQYVVYAANKGDGRKLYVHRFGEREGREVPGLGDNPYFGHISPNNEWLLFGKKAWMWKAPLYGGDLIKVQGGNPWLIWDTDSTFVANFGNTLRRVKADGSQEYEEVFKLETTSGVTGFSRPSMLPEGKGALVSVWYGERGSKNGIGVITFSDKKLTIIEERAINPRYSESGHILYTQGSTLKAIPFDLDSLQATGDPATVVEGVHIYSNLASQFDISKNGTLVYIPGPCQIDRWMPKTLVWVDREGKESPFNTMERDFGCVRISPSWRYVAAEAGSAALFVFDRLSGTWTRLATGSGTKGAPVWAQDSGSLFYTRMGALGRQRVDEDGKWGEWEELIPAEARFWGNSLSKDGSQILGTMIVSDPEQWQMGSASTKGAKKAEPIVGGNGITRRNPEVSPDGNWLAYVEKNRGLDQVYVQAYPDRGNRVLVSEGAIGEAAEPAWGADETELFYRDAANMVSVRLETTPMLRVKDVTRLFAIRFYAQHLNTWATVHDYDPGTDRFLMVKWSLPELPPTDIHVIKNAFELLNRIAPPKR
jgi:hypothetical protein